MVDRPRLSRWQLRRREEAVDVRGRVVDGGEDGDGSVDRKGERPLLIARSETHF